MTKFLSIFILFLIASCSSYTIASLSTNIVTVTSTGRTNSDHVVSYFTGKDCKIYRAVKNKNICNQKQRAVALDEEKNNFDNIKNNKIKKSINMAYHITKNVVKDHATAGARITDTIKLTKELEKKIESRFDGSNKPKKQSKLTEENLKEENIFKKDFWGERVEEEKEKRERIKQKFLAVFNKANLFNKDIVYVTDNNK